MASVREVSSIAEDLLCAVCLSIFQDPHMLGCGHNFCLSCLESCVIRKGQHWGTCPECRHPFDLQDAARNRVLANLAQKARLLRLEEASQSGGAGSWQFCEEHEEPLKLFCSQEEVPICVICRDLPQHQGHNFLPIKNAVKSYQDKLKASLEPLEDGVKWATNNQSRQQETIEELENLCEHLCGCIFIEFENLREILNEREQNMLETVRQMKEDNQAEMEGKLEYLKAYESSHNETISKIQAALEETNEFAFLKAVKKLMEQIQDRLRERSEETGSEAGAAKESEAKDLRDEEVNENVADTKGAEAISDEREDFEEPLNIEEDEYEDIVPVGPALGVLEESLDFETWKEMLRAIGIGENYAPDSSCYSPPPPEEDMLQPGESDISEAAEEAARANLVCTMEASTLVQGEDPLDKQVPFPNSGFSSVPPMGEALYKPPLYLPNLPMPIFQQMPLYNYSLGRGWGSSSHRWPHPRRGRGMPQRRGTPQGQPFCARRGQGRGYSNKQMSQPSESSTVGQDNCRSLQKELLTPRETHVSGQRGRWFNKPRPQSSGGNISGQRGGGSEKKEPPKPREDHVSGQGGSGRGQGPANKSSTHQKGGDASSVSKGSQSRHQTSHHGGRGGRGSGSAKGPQKK